MKELEITQREVALKQIITAAGQQALAFFQQRKAGEYTLKGHQDFLTEADTAVETFILQALQSAFPTDLILSEESARLPDNAASLWVVDPIDGTANFARGIAHFCVCIAWVHEDKTELGAIYQPVTDELYLTRRGSYVTKNSKPIRCSSLSETAAASIELGWSARLPAADYLRVMSHLLACGCSVRRGGSGALALAWVAEGRTDGYIESHMNAWDCLAGLLMVEEAGGQTGAIPTDAAGIFQGLPVLASAAGIATPVAGAAGIPLSAMRATAAPETVKHYPRPAVSLITENLPGWGVDIYIGGSEGVCDAALLAKHDIGIVINCAVNLDIDWVIDQSDTTPGNLRHGAAAIRYYKLGLVDGEGNAPEMLHAGYQLMRSALQQQLPDKPSYRNQRRGNILINCRGGRSRSVALVALFLHLECPQHYPSLDDAIALIREQRQLHPDEWFETPKPALISLAEYAIVREKQLRTIPSHHA
ncbi:MAG: Inositol-1-monophosphatase [Candidatus Erwinia impunctatus]|nr:Inositol-1-monophosphatase [Culicoides impunctatus]